MSKICGNRLFDRVQTVGEFYCDSGIFEVCDPLINAFNCDAMPVCAANQATVYLRNCVSGRYKVIYEFDSHGEPASVFFASNAIDYYTDVPLLVNSFTKVGNVYPAFGKCVCLVESNYRDDARYSFYELEPDAIYDPLALSASIPNSPYPSDTKASILQYLTACIRKGSYALGEDLLMLTSSQNIYWNGYRSVNVKSTHWAVDVSTRVHNGPVPISIIQGGVVLNSFESDCCPVYCLKGRNGTVGIRIFLRDEIESVDGATQGQRCASVIPFHLTAAGK